MFLFELVKIDLNGVVIYFVCLNLFEYICISIMIWFDVIDMLYLNFDILQIII